MQKSIITLLIGVLAGMALVKFFPKLFIECEQLDCYGDTAKVETDTVHIIGEEVVKWDTVTKIVDNSKPVTSSVEALNDSSNIHTSVYRDSVLEATVTSTVTGRLDSQTMDYKINIPVKEVTRVDTIKIDTKVYINPKSYHRIYGGAKIQGNGSYIDYGVTLSYQSPNNKIIYRAGYSFNNNLGNAIMIGIDIPLFKWQKKQ